MTAYGAYVALAGMAAILLSAALSPIIGLAWCLIAGLVEPAILED